MTNRKRTWIYCRTAYPENPEIALDDQETKLREYCEKNGWQIVGVSRVVGSGSHISDELKNRVMPAAKNEDFARLLSVGMTRICRNASELLSFSREMLGFTIEICDIHGTEISPLFQELLALSHAIQGSDSEYDTNEDVVIEI